MGLDDYNARLYDPGLGRFLSTDPVIGHPGSTQSINPYSYVENNPLNRTDPTGQMSCTPSGDGKTMTCTYTPTGSHIQQTTTVKAGSNGQVTTSGAGALPGGGIALTTDGNTSATFSLSKSGGQGQGSTAQNSTGDTSVSKHQVDNRDSSGSITHSEHAKTSKGSSNGELTPAKREKAFKKGLAYDKAHGLIPKGHHFVFNNHYVAAHLNADGTVDNSVPIKPFDTEAKAQAFVNTHPGYAELGGLTTLNSHTSTIYAGATDVGSMRGYGGYPETFASPESHVEFDILHELQHQLGVSNEIDADIRARMLLPNSGG